MDSLVNVQLDIQNRMSRARQNYKKSPKDRVTEQYVEIRLESLEQLWSQFNETHRDIVKLWQGEECSYFADDIIEAVEELYIDYKTELKYSLASLQSTNRVVSNNCTHSPASTSNIQMPRIVIPYFSGLYTEWVTFRDLYISLVHTNDQLDNVQKMHYLKAYLTGEAEQLLRHIPIADVNYERCWMLLNNRYNNKKYLSHTILKRLLSQKNIAYESSSGLKNLMDTTNDCLISLTTLGIDVSTWDAIVIHILTLKLDTESRKQWEINITNINSSEELPTFSQFNEFITKRYRALEFLDSKSTTVTDNKLKTMHVLHNNQCTFCSGNHKISLCKNFANQNVNSRRNFVQNNNICFNCLGNNHSAVSCKSINRCRICKKQHHSLLHPNNVDTSDSSGKTNSTTNDAESNSKRLSAFFSSGSVKCNHVLLPTALVKAVSETGKQFVIRALLDQGSQTSFISEATVQYLGLKKTSIKEYVSVLGGDMNISSEAIVTINLRSMVDPSYKMSVKAYVLKSITSFLPDKKLDSLEWLESLNIQLADPNYHTPNKIDILLGAEVYSKIILKDVIKAPHETSVVQCTSLGWIITVRNLNSNRSVVQRRSYKVYVYDPNKFMGGNTDDYSVVFRADDSRPCTAVCRNSTPSNQIFTLAHIQNSQLHGTLLPQ
ncbi:uncharacterized protein LOC131851578 [Achroia grisella]|uniref:uncharacterized protein LOC131851578 n=1 Tax=Achroia grisella TaxID=688607 RepID=UPI0027D3286E|nr:uncharacterized protein LOC131851578 [Achroia grisella]